MSDSGTAPDPGSSLGQNIDNKQSLSINKQSDSSSLEVLVNLLNVAGKKQFSKLLTVERDANGDYSILGEVLYKTDYVKAGLDKMADESDKSDTVTGTGSDDTATGSRTVTDDQASLRPDSVVNDYLNDNKQNEANNNIPSSPSDFPELKKLRTVKDGLCGVSIISINMDDSESEDSVIRKNSRIVLVRNKVDKKIVPQKGQATTKLGSSTQNQRETDNHSDDVENQTGSDINKSISENSESDSSEDNDSESGTKFLERNFQVLWHFIPNDSEPCLIKGHKVKHDLERQLYSNSRKPKVGISEAIFINSDCYYWVLIHAADYTLLSELASGWGVILNPVIIMFYLGSSSGIRHHSNAITNLKSKQLQLPDGIEYIIIDWECKTNDIEPGGPTSDGAKCSDLIKILPKTIRYLSIVITDYVKNSNNNLNNDRKINRIIMKSDIRKLTQLTQLCVEGVEFSNSDIGNSNDHDAVTETVTQSLPTAASDNDPGSDSGDFSFLPATLTKLSLPRNYTSSIQPSTLPPKLERLISRNAKLETSSSQDSDSDFPPTLFFLSIGGSTDSLNRLFSSETHTLNLPKSLKTLNLTSSSFDDNIRDGVFPKGLEHLSFGSLTAFDQSLDDICMLPDSLKTLTLFPRFNDLPYPEVE